MNYKNNVPNKFFTKISVLYYHSEQAAAAFFESVSICILRNKCIFLSGTADINSEQVFGCSARIERESLDDTA